MSKKEKNYEGVIKSGLNDYFERFKDEDVKDINEVTDMADLMKAYDNAYRYNEHFCNQRTICFNFYLAIVTVIIGIQINVLLSDIVKVKAFYCFSGFFFVALVIISIVFNLMDKRSKLYLEYIGDLLRIFEKMGGKRSFNVVFTTDKVARDSFKNKIISKGLSLRWTIIIVTCFIPICSFLASVALYMCKYVF